MKNKTWIGRLKKVWPGCRRFARRHAKSALGLLVAISTVAPLVTPALTLSIPVSCGLEEHTHTDACYGEPMPVCDQKETEGHVHTEDCYAPVLLCGLTEHTHTAACGKQAEQIPSGETPGTEEIPGTSGPGEIPSTEEVPGTSESTETSGTEEVPETSESTETSGTEEIPGTSESTGTSGTEEIPGTSESTGTSGTDEIPGTSESTETPGTEETPGTSEPGETPSTGEAAVIIDSDEIPMDTESLGAQNAALYSAEVPGGNCGTVTITGKTDYGYIDTYEVADNLTWTFQDGILTISGTGEMGDFGSYYETRTGYDEYEGSYYEYESYIGSVDCPWEDVKSEIKQVVVEEGVTSIGGGAFRYHSNLEGITLPESLETIGRSAFESCSSLEGITLPESLKTIGEGAFNSCRNLISASLPSGLTEISNSLFSSCEKLTEITIPEGVTSIGESAFSSCRSLNGIALPESVTSIGASAFSYCENIKEINLPSGVTEIGGSAFSGTAITEIKLPDGLKALGSALSGCDTLESVILPNGITEIADNAFNGCSNLKSIELSEGITSIGNSAFYNCSNLETINFPESLTYIGETAFYGCSSLTGIQIKSNELVIGGAAFYSCTGLKEVNIACDTLTLEELLVREYITTGVYDEYYVGTFDGCSSLSTVTISGMDHLISNLFAGCASLKELNLTFGPQEEHELRSGVFYGCTSLEEFIIPEGITRIADYAFSYITSLKNIEIPDSVTSIGNYAFNGCSGLSDLKIPAGVTTIGKGAFSGCTGLSELELPNGISLINDELFSGCTALQSVNIPDGITSIGKNAFANCSSLQSIEIPGNVTTIGSSAFYGCAALQQASIPDGVTSIEDSTFYNCTSLQKVDISSDVTLIGNNAFSGCAGLMEIKISDSVTSIGNSAFSGCAGLTEIEIPDGVTSIGNSAFSGCTGIVDIKVPDTVTTIGNNAFSNCTNLQNVELSEALTQIPASLFSDCTSLKEVVIPEGVTSIGVYEGYYYGKELFENCTALKRVVLPSTLKTINSPYLFRNSGIEEIVLNTSEFEISQSGTAYNQLHIMLGEGFFGEDSQISGELLDKLIRLGMNSFTAVSGKAFKVDLKDKENKLLLPHRLFETGMYCADVNGNLYLLKEEIEEATLVYCASNAQTCTIPATVTADDRTYSVTGVAARAFVQAEGLEQLDFEAPDQIARLGDLAFAEALNLAAVNGERTEEAVLKTFTGLKKIGARVFHNTKIEGRTEGTNSTEGIVLWGETENGTSYPVKVSLNESTLNMLRSKAPCTLLTGQTAILDFQIGNKPEEQETPPDGFKGPEKVELYVEFGSTDLSSVDLEALVDGSQKTGGAYQVYDKEGEGAVLIATIKAEKIDNKIYYLEITYMGSGTVTLPIRISSQTRVKDIRAQIYPGRDSSVSAGDYIDLEWTFLPYTYRIKQPEKSVAQGSFMNVYIEDPEGGEEKSEVTLQKADTAPLFPFKYNESSIEEIGRQGINEDKVISDDEGWDRTERIYYTTVISLKDTGLTLTDDAAKAVEEGTYQIQYGSSSVQPTVKINGRDAIKACNSYYSYYNSYFGWDDLSWDSDKEELTLHYYVRNSSSSSNARIGVSGAFFAMQYGENLFKVTKADELKAKDTFGFDTRTTAVAEYSFSEPKEVEGEINVRVNIEVPEPDIEVLVTEKDVTIRNISILPYDKLLSMHYSLPNDYYITAESLAKMFSEDKTHELKAVTISNASVVKEEFVPIKEEKDGIYPWSGDLPLQYLNQHNELEMRNGDYTIETGNETVTVKWDSSQSQIVIQKGDGILGTGILAPSVTCAPEAEEIQKAFEELRIMINNTTTYGVEWEFEEGFVLKGSRSIVKSLPVTLKDAFMMLNTDQVGDHNSYVYAKPSCYCVCKEDIRKEGQIVSGNFTGENRRIQVPESKELAPTVNGKVPETYKSGDRLTYKIKYNLQNAHETNQPVEIVFKGKQYLYARVDYSWCELKPRAEPYRDVYLSGFTGKIDSIFVSEVNGEIVTHIRYINTKGSVTQTFETVVMKGDEGETIENPSLSVDLWMGAHEGHRIHKGWVPERAEVDKEIVKIQRGNETIVIGTDEQKEAWPTYNSKYSTIHEGDKVTYRLSLRYYLAENQRKKVTYVNLSDALPKGSIWNASKIRLWVGDEEGNPIESDQIKNLNSWKVDGYGNDKTLKWNSGFEATIGSEPLYIYVELAYPTGSAWQSYVNSFGGKALNNTVTLFDKTASVQHVLSATALATLQKGVLNSQVLGSPRVGAVSNPYERLLYSNDDRFNRAVYYYITVRNEGHSRLYLPEIQDTMPEGFTFAGMSNYYYVYRGSANVTNYSLEDMLQGQFFKPANNYKYVNSTGGNNVVYERIKVTGNGIGNGKIRFTFGKGAGEYDYTNRYNTADNYDENLNMAFLNPGEALVFCYGCRTNRYTMTEDIATGRAAMPYYIDNDIVLGFENGKERYSLVTTSGGTTAVSNDGDSEQLTIEQAANMNFTVDSTYSKWPKSELTGWLSSEVTVSRGGFQPGVKVEWYGTRNSNGSWNTSSNNVGLTSVLGWKVTAKNGGVYPIYDYVITDEIQKGSDFMFGEELKLEFLSGSGSNTVAIPLVCDKDGKPVIGEDNKLQIDFGKVTNAELREQLQGCAIMMDTTDFGTRLSIHIKADKLAVPAQGQVSLIVPTLRRNTSISGGAMIITDTVHFTPGSENWNTHTDGTLDKNYEDAFHPGDSRNSLTDSAMVVIGNVIATNAYKKVAVKAGDGTATTLDSSQLLDLEQKDALITYELEVYHNEKAAATTKDAVVIDILPQKGDTMLLQGGLARGSEYSVVLADAPNFEASIILKDKTVRKLNPEEYKIYLSTSSNIVDDDWKAEQGDTEKWVLYQAENHMDLGQYQVIKLVVEGEVAASFAADTSLTLRFDCKIPESEYDVITRGATAWNDFAYKLRLGSQSDTQAYRSKSDKVSITFNGVPEITKRLRTVGGEPFAAETEMECRFLIYTGDKVGLSEGFTEKELGEALKGRQYLLAEVTIQQGASKSDSLLLDKMKSASFNGETFVTGTDDWSWEEGESYSMVELPFTEEGIKDEYHFGNINDVPGLTYTFTYDPSTNQQLVCSNVHNSWAFKLEKVDAADNSKKLQGAVFALYGTVDKEAMTQKELEELQEKYPELQIPEPEENYSLVAVTETDAAGLILWQDLTGEEYLYKELRAPDGYYITDTGNKKAEKPEEEGKVITFTVTNKAGYEIPKTGGTGTFAYVLSGTALLFGALGLMLARYGRRKRIR